MENNKNATINTNWTKATTDPQEALSSLMSCLLCGHNAWLEIRKNGDQSLPISIINPELDDPFNWEFNFGSFATTASITKFLNETEKDLMLNWEHAYATKEAAEAYRKHGKITKGLFNGSGESIPVKRRDAQRYRDTFVKDGYQYQKPSSSKPTWMNFWRPKKNIRLWVPDPKIQYVFTVCFDNKERDLYTSLKRAENFFKECAEHLDLFEFGAPRKENVCDN